MLLDVTLGTWVPSISSPSPLQLFASELLQIGSENPVPFLEQLLPMAVERGRRTYSHCPDCLYLRRNGEWSGRGDDGEQDEDGMMLLCSCGAGKVGGGVFRGWMDRLVGPIEYLFGLACALPARRVWSRGKGTGRWVRAF